LNTASNGRVTNNGAYNSRRATRSLAGTVADSLLNSETGNDNSDVPKPFLWPYRVRNEAARSVEDLFELPIREEFESQRRETYKIMSLEERLSVPIFYFVSWATIVNHGRRKVRLQLEGSSPKSLPRLSPI
jgi:hypothetical protein